MISMVVSIPPLLGTSLLNQDLHTVKLEPGGAFDISDCFRDFIKNESGMPRAPLTTLATKNLRLQILDHTLAPLPLEEDISGSCTIHLAFCFFFLSDMSPFSEGELLEPGQGGPLPGLPIPQGVGPSTSAGHIQVND